MIKGLKGRCDKGFSRLGEGVEMSKGGKVVSLGGGLESVWEGDFWGKNGTKG